jgi:DNA-directed RNA polymerase subunit alpha
MAILDFQKPEKVIMIDSTDHKGQFEFRPLEPGFGVTVGNAFRRILLSSLEGFAISSVKFEGVDHEYSTIPGIIQDITEIILNLKQIRFKQQIDGTNSERVVVNISGQNKVTAGDIGKYTSAFQVLNPDLLICEMDGKVNMNFELTIDKGRGYVPADENKDPNAAIGTIAIDSIYTPIKHVRYKIENYRVEQKTDYEKLVIELETDGSVTPKDALQEAAKILIHHFMLFSDEKITLDLDDKSETEEFDESALQMRQVLKKKLSDMDLSVRALNCLKAADIESLGDLVSYKKTDLLKFRNFGRKSLTELEDLIEQNSLTFGMNVSKYKLEKE